MAQAGRIVDKKDIKAKSIKEKQIANKLISLSDRISRSIFRKCTIL